MKFLIVGLGNPGREYEETRHNIGFKVLDQLASGTFFSPDRLASVAEIRIKGRILLLIKPTTFMNLSGKAVQYWLQQEKLLPEQMLVVTDDIALPLGTVRLKPRGSDGGHNGLKNIQETLGTDTYPRLRFGIGNDFTKGRQVDYVLGTWTPDETPLLNTRISLAAEAAKSFCLQGLSRTMNEFNNR
jgi:PTH1 family peptidyl-tRNA hydrolase